MEDERQKDATRAQVEADQDTAGKMRGHRDTEQLDVGITSGTPDQETSPEKRLQESLWNEPSQQLFEAGGTLERSAPANEPRTGVGTPDQGAEAGGAELGGDTGDVGTPRDEIGGAPGGTWGTGAEPEAGTSSKSKKAERHTTKRRAA